GREDRVLHAADVGARRVGPPRRYGRGRRPDRQERGRRSHAAGDGLPIGAPAEQGAAPAQRGPPLVGGAEPTTRGGDGLMEAWGSVTMRIDPGEKPTVTVDTTCPDGDLYNTMLSLVTEHDDHLTLVFESPMHLQMWVIGIFGETRRYVDDG